MGEDILDKIPWNTTLRALRKINNNTQMNTLRN